MADGFQEFLGTASGTSQTPTQGVVDRSVGQALTSAAELGNMALDIRDKNLVNEFTGELSGDLTTAEPEAEENVRAFSNEIGRIETSAEQGRLRGDPRVLVSRKLQRAISDAPHLASQFEKVANRALKRSDVSSEIAAIDQRIKLENSVLEQAVKESPMLLTTTDLGDPLQKQQVIQNYAAKKAMDERIEQGFAEDSADFINAATMDIGVGLSTLSSNADDQTKAQVVQEIEGQRIRAITQVTQQITQLYPEKVGELPQIKAQINSIYDQGKNYVSNINDVVKTTNNTLQQKLKLSVPQSIRQIEVLKDAFGEQTMAAMVQVAAPELRTALQDISTIAGADLGKWALNSTQRLATGEYNSEDLSTQELPNVYQYAGAGFLNGNFERVTGDQATNTVRSFDQSLRALNRKGSEDAIINAGRDLASPKFRSQYINARQRGNNETVAEFAQTSAQTISAAVQTLKRNILSTRGLQETDLLFNRETREFELNPVAINETDVENRRFFPLFDSTRENVLSMVRTLNGLSKSAAVVARDLPDQRDFLQLIGEVQDVTDDSENTAVNNDTTTVQD